MYLSELRFIIKPERNKENILDAIEILFGALRMNGQIIGKEFPGGYLENTYYAYLMLPDEDSLDLKYSNAYVINALDKLTENEVSIDISIRGIEPYSAPVCKCHSPASYILYTNYTLMESPIRCSDCFGTIPLYKLPIAINSEYGDILSWESDYKACDTLQMNCSTGERFAISQMSKYDSSLTKRGLDICKRVNKLAGKPMYYYLYHPIGRGKKSEMRRKCPSCDDEWLLNEQLYGFVNFKCDKCNLLSNIAWSTR